MAKSGHSYYSASRLKNNKALSVILVSVFLFYGEIISPTFTVIIMIHTKDIYLREDYYYFPYLVCNPFILIFFIL